LDIKENSGINARILKRLSAVVYFSQFLVMSQSQSQMHSALYISMCGNVSNSEPNAQ